MAKSPYRLEMSIKKYFAPILRGDGFSGSGRCYRRVAGDLIQVVQVQGSRNGGKFAVNLAIQPIAVPDVLGNAPNPAHIRDELCEFRRRLSELRADQWWEHDGSEESIDAAVLRAVAVYSVHGRKVFAEQSDTRSSLHTITPEQFESGRYRFSGFANTEVRMARALALMRKASGSVDQARAFARIGLARVGNAVALRKEFEQLCAFVEQSQ
jgi:hypothetical protein